VDFQTALPSHEHHAGDQSWLTIWLSLAQGWLPPWPTMLFSRLAVSGLGSPPVSGMVTRYFTFGSLIQGWFRLGSEVFQGGGSPFYGSLLQSLGSLSQKLPIPGSHRNRYSHQRYVPMVQSWPSLGIEVAINRPVSPLVRYADACGRPIRLLSGRAARLSGNDFR
jgi:hypothetical protein